MKAYFLRLHCHDEFLWLNISPCAQFSSVIWEDLDVRRLPPCEIRRIWTRETRLVDESSELLRTLCAKSSTLYPLTTYLELSDNGDKHESRWRNRLPRDNLSNVQLQTLRRCTLAMAVLAREKNITFMTSLRKNVLIENRNRIVNTIETWSMCWFSIFCHIIKSIVRFNREFSLKYFNRFDYWHIAHLYIFIYIIMIIK